jgi:hypothetical protein
VSRLRYFASSEQPRGLAALVDLPPSVAGVPSPLEGVARPKIHITNVPILRMQIASYCGSDLTPVGPLLGCKYVGGLGLNGRQLPEGAQCCQHGRRVGRNWVVPGDDPVPPHDF